MADAAKKPPVKIDSPIVGFKVLTDEDKNDSPELPAVVEDAVEPEYKLEVIHPDMVRPPRIYGQTWRIRPPTEETSLYMTINDVVLNAGTEHECHRPLEIFLNSKHMESYMWVTALTVTISGLMHAGNDLSFLPNQLMQIADPKSGGYFGKSRAPGKEKKGQHYISVVSEIGHILKHHFIELGILPSDPLTIAEEKKIKEIADKPVTSAIPSMPVTDINGMGAERGFIPGDISAKLDAFPSIMGRLTVLYASGEMEDLASPTTALPEGAVSFLHDGEEWTILPDRYGFIRNLSLPDLGLRCVKCNTPNVVIQDGCPTCMEGDCGFSKCG